MPKRRGKLARWDEPWGAGLVLNEPVSDVARARCACGDCMWWRYGHEAWQCRTCIPPPADSHTYWMRRKNVVDPTEAETVAIHATVAPAGEFLDALGQTDLALLSEQDFLTFIEVVVSAYQENLNAITAP